MNLASLSLDTGFVEFRVLAIRRDSEVNLVSELQHLDIFQILTVVLSSLQCNTPQTLCPRSDTLDM